MKRTVIGGTTVLGILALAGVMPWYVALGLVGLFLAALIRCKGATGG